MLHKNRDHADDPFIDTERIRTWWKETAWPWVKISMLGKLIWSEKKDSQDSVEKEEQTSDALVEISDSNEEIDNNETTSEIEFELDAQPEIEKKPIIPMRVILDNQKIIEDEDSTTEDIEMAFNVLREHLDIEKEGEYKDFVQPILEKATIRAANTYYQPALEYLGDLPNNEKFAPPIWTEALSATRVPQRANAAFDQYTTFIKKTEKVKLISDYIDAMVSQVGSPKSHVRDKAFNEVTALLDKEASNKKGLNSPQTKKVMAMLKDLVANDKDTLKVQAARKITKHMKEVNLDKTYAAQYTNDLKEVVSKIENNSVLRELGGANEVLFNVTIGRMAEFSITGDRAARDFDHFPKCMTQIQIHAEQNAHLSKGKDFLAILQENKTVCVFLEKNAAQINCVKDFQKNLEDYFKKEEEKEKEAKKKQKPAVGK